MASHSRLVSGAVAVLVGILTAVAAGQDAGAQWFKREVGNLKTKFAYDVHHGCEEDVDDQSTDLSMTRQRLGVFVPICQTEVEEFAAKAHVGVWDLDTGARLTRPDVSMPEHLWDVGAGGTWRRKLDNGWIVGAGMDVSSPSDEPFESCEEVAVNALVNLHIPVGERDGWLFFLQYANNRSFAPHVPLPAVAYQWVPDPRRFRAVLGLPYASVWAQPIDRLTLEARYLMLRRVHAKIGYRLLEPLEVYVGYDWDNNRFFRAAREDDDDRLFYYEMRATAGLRWEITEGLFVDAFGGYAFERFFFEGEDYDDRDDSRINIEDGCFMGMKVGLRF